jgi:peroxiredoxin
MSTRTFLFIALLAVTACGRKTGQESSETPSKTTPPDTVASADRDTVHSRLYPGKPFPAVEILDLDENKVNAASLVAGRPSLVLFIDPDCESCRAFLEVWDKQVNALPAGLNVIGITKVDPQYAKQYKQDSGFPHPLYSDQDGIFARDYRIKIYPTVVGTYPDGGVAFVGKAVTPEFTPKKAAALLGEMVAARKQQVGG